MKKIQQTRKITLTLSRESLCVLDQIKDLPHVLGGAGDKTGMVTKDSVCV